MATKEIKEITCDVCSIIIKSDTHKATNLSVVFTTEQTEGRSTEPYLSLVKIDICPTCMKSILLGKMLFAHGAMGFNQYYFK